jgi:hypothetical protein
MSALFTASPENVGFVVLAEVVADVAVAAFPLIAMFHVPEAPPPVLVGASLAISAFTKAVVAICVVSVPTEAVGAVGVPLSAGEASGAFALSCVWIADVTPDV